jgi:hypothetical protein
LDSEYNEANEEDEANVLLGGDYGLIDERSYTI